MSNFKTSAIILAGGSGSRMECDKTKQFITILDKTILERTVFAFEQSKKINDIVLVVRENELDDAIKVIRNCILTKPIKYVVGGKCRAESAKNGFETIKNESDFVVIHDIARCLITAEMIDKVVEKAYIHGAATAVCSISDTVKVVDCNGKITSTIPRERVYRAQTPQVFSNEVYKRALDKCSDLTKITDDNMLVEEIGAEICTVDLGPSNIKITTKEDLSYARNILIERGENSMDGLRIGHGYDVHRLVDGRKLIIGGVEIPYEKGLLGHSDSDVLLHAIMDSLLGAAALGDIGQHFPDTCEEFCNVSSIYLLTRVVELIKNEGFKIVNVDATVILQKPKIAPYVEKMKSNIAFALGLPEKCVNVKATTEEHLGFTGREEGASAHSVALLTRY